MGPGAEVSGWPSTRVNISWRSTKKGGPGAGGPRPGLGHRGGPPGFPPPGRLSPAQAFGPTEGGGPASEGKQEVREGGKGSRRSILFGKAGGWDPQGPSFAGPPAGGQACQSRAGNGYTPGGALDRTGPRSLCPGCLSNKAFYPAPVSYYGFTGKTSRPKNLLGLLLRNRTVIETILGRPRHTAWVEVNFPRRRSLGGRGGSAVKKTPPHSVPISGARTKIAYEKYESGPALRTRVPYLLQFMVHHGAL